MAEEDTFTDNTIQIISAVTDTPKLSKNLLLKPPYRFLYDIIINIQKKTNFAKNLFNEEEVNSGKPVVIFINLNLLFFFFIAKRSETHFSRSKSKKYVSPKGF
jgi:hypothetical protein